MSISTTRQKMEKQILLMLGSQMVDVELDPDHVDLAITLAIEKLRQLSEHSTEEVDLLLEVQEDLQTYTLPTEIQEVRRLYRRGIGGVLTSGGEDFDPMSAMFTAGYFLTGNRGGGSLASYEFAHAKMETANRLFASEHNFIYTASTNTLRIINKIHRTETVIVRCYSTQSEDSIITDTFTGPWIRSYAIAQCKGMLGQGRGKFTSGLPGPSGNVMLNGSELLQQSMAEMESLEKDLEGWKPYGFIIG